MSWSIRKLKAVYYAAWCREEAKTYEKIAKTRVTLSNLANGVSYLATKFCIFTLVCDSGVPKESHFLLRTSKVILSQFALCPNFALNSSLPAVVEFATNTVVLGATCHTRKYARLRYLDISYAYQASLKQVRRVSM